MTALTQRLEIDAFILLAFYCGYLYRKLGEPQ